MKKALCLLLAGVILLGAGAVPVIRPRPLTATSRRGAGVRMSLRTGPVLG
jgi:hypothetical protein